MPIYTFYPRMTDGAALSFDAVELADDQAAVNHCQLVLSQHLSATRVVVWENDRQVYGADRAAPPRLASARDAEQAEA